MLLTGRVEIRNIEFRDGEGVNYHFNGGDGYSIPAGQPSALVTFRVREDRNTHSDFTIVMSRRYQSIDAMLNDAWLKLAARLEGYTTTAKELREVDKNRQQATAAQSAG